MIIDRNDPASVDLTVSVLNDNNVCVLPCDTIYGLSSVYIDGEAVLKNLKGRDANKPFIVLCTKEMALSLCKSVPENVLEAWPCALTAILEKKDGGTVGIRVPDDPFLQSVLNKLGRPVYSTSVNMSGEPSLLDFDSIRNAFEDRVSLLVKGFETQGTVASTIVDCTTSEFRILRQGSYIFN